LIVVDATAVVAALVRGDEVGARVRAQVAEGPAWAPELLSLEVASGLRRLTATGRLNPVRAALALRDLLELPLSLVPHRPLVTRAWELRENVSIYDAAYIALAELLDATLLTADRRLASAPRLRCEVEVLD
jgi:predicted nucleic acid-binding protein